MDLGDDAFLGTAAVAAGQVSRGELENRRRFRRPARDVYIPVDVGASLVERCRALRLTLPGDATFSHYTAAALYGVELPEEPLIHVSTCGPVETRMTGVIGHRIQALEHPTWRYGLPLTSPAQTYLDLAARLDLVSLVIAGDRLAALCADGVRDLEHVVKVGRGHRGVALARHALWWIDPGSRSSMETRLRFLLVSAGFPKPRCNQPVYDEVGEFVAEPDLHVADVRVAHEYESDRHRERRQWELDIKRDEQLHRLGWILIKVTSTDLYSRPSTVVERTRDAYARRSVHVPHGASKAQIPGGIRSGAP
jgi:hypothetical protein